MQKCEAYGAERHAKNGNVLIELCGSMFSFNVASTRGRSQYVDGTEEGQGPARDVEYFLVCAFGKCVLWRLVSA